MVKDTATGQSTTLIESATIMEQPSRGRTMAPTSCSSASRRARSVSLWSFASKTISPFVQSATFGAAFSPDDKYVALASNESGRFETYVTTFPERRQTWPLTTEGGRVVSWRDDGREILVATLSGTSSPIP